MARVHVLYKGRTIAVELKDLGYGWQWSYQIDAGRVQHSLELPAPDEHVATNEAIGRAQREIDAGEY